MDTRLTTLEAAAITGVSRGTILRWIKLGYLGDVEKQNVTRGKDCGYKIEISALNRYLYRRHFGYTHKRTSPDVYNETELNLCMDAESLRKTKQKLIKVINRAQAELDRIEAML